MLMRHNATVAIASMLGSVAFQVQTGGTGTGTIHMCFDATMREAVGTTVTVTGLDIAHAAVERAVKRTFSAWGRSPKRYRWLRLTPPWAVFQSLIPRRCNAPRRRPSCSSTVPRKSGTSPSSLRTKSMRPRRARACLDATTALKTTERYGLKSLEGSAHYPTTN